MSGNEMDVTTESTGLNVLANNIPGGMFRCLFDEKLTLLEMNQGFLSLCGYTREEIHRDLNDSFKRLIDPRDWDETLKSVRHQISIGSSKELEYRMVCKDGSIKWVLDKGERVLTSDNLESFCCILVDITQSKETQEELRLSLERHEIIMDQTTDIIFEWDIIKDTLSYSPNWEKKFGYMPLSNHIRSDILVRSHIHPDDRKAFADMLDEIKAGRHYRETEFRLRTIDGGYIWCRARLTCQKNKMGEPFKAVGVIIDIDHEKRKAQALLADAQRDALTKLFNKGTAQQLIEERLKIIGPEICSALFIIDIDDFKYINDSKGHLFGDAFLVEASREIEDHFRNGDIVGRIGGDEFIVYMHDIPGPDAALKKAESLVVSFLGLNEAQSDLNISCSIGISVVPQHGSRFYELFQKADLALYQAKSLGKNQYCLYDDAMENNMPGVSSQLRSALGAKIDSNELVSGLNGQLVEYVFQILYQSLDVEAAVNSILEIAGRQLDVSRAYIFENSEDAAYCNNTFEWCNEGVAPEIHNLQHVSYEEDLGGNYIKNFDEDGVFYCKDIQILSKRQYDILAPQGIKSLLQCAIYDSGEFKGFVGFDECRDYRYWDQDQIAILSFISEILSTFLMKKRAEDRALQSATAMQAILDNQNSWIYVIDPDDYSLFYINRKTRALVPSARLGMKCYEAFFGVNGPCSYCPARDIRKKLNQTLEIYNPYLKVWSLADATLIPWKGNQAVLLCCHDINQYKENQSQ